jgi:glycosyltransferase involved in cell wall biosynthesis
MERRRFLTPLLSRAQAILCVSRAFADVYRSSGFGEAIAVPNGVSPLVKADRVASETGRVRLTHIGGRSKFKGYGLIAAAFKQSRFANLDLTVVDETRYGGREYSETWGATPVRIVGKTVSENMHEYYARHDVLLAPSLWPEPFGLVTREALAAGLWVIAGNRGAIGEDVVPGVNGWVIDVSTPRGLLDALSQIDAEPNKYLTSPPPTRLRTSREQADEIVAIYRRVIADPRNSQVPYARTTVARPRDTVSDVGAPSMDVQRRARGT